MFGFSVPHREKICAIIRVNIKERRAKVIIFGIKLKLMKCRLEVTYLYGLLTYLNVLTLNQH
jgi:hypothetical protein